MRLHTATHSNTLQHTATHAPQTRGRPTQQQQRLIAKVVYSVDTSSWRHMLLRSLPLLSAHDLILHFQSWCSIYCSWIIVDWFKLILVWFWYCQHFLAPHALQHAATHWYTLQHAVARCNTLQHAETRLRAENGVRDRKGVCHERVALCCMCCRGTILLGAHSHHFPRFAKSCTRPHWSLAGFFWRKCRALFDRISGSFGRTYSSFSFWRIQSSFSFWQDMGLFLTGNRSLLFFQRIWSFFNVSLNKT